MQAFMVFPCIRNLFRLKAFGLSAYGSEALSRTLRLTVIRASQFQCALTYSVACETFVIRSLLARTGARSTLYPVCSEGYRTPELRPSLAILRGRISRNQSEDCGIRADRPDVSVTGYPRASTRSSLCCCESLSNSSSVIAYD